MSSRVQKHLFYYFSLTVILIMGIFFAVQFSYNKQSQMIVVAMTSLFYVGWGILHHFVHHDLNVKIVIEYVLIGSLGMTVVLFIIKGGL